MSTGIEFQNFETTTENQFHPVRFILNISNDRFAKGEKREQTKRNE